jgi:transcriptional regulator with XRE-family HTH domain
MYRQAIPANFFQIRKMWSKFCLMNIGKVIRQLREKQGWSQDELAFRSGTTAANISRIEGGRHGPRADLLGSIAYVFGLKVYQLMALAEGVLTTIVTGEYSTDEETVLAYFRRMPKEEQELYKSIGESFVRVRRVRESTEAVQPQTPND